MIVVLSEGDRGIALEAECSMCKKRWVRSPNDPLATELPHWARDHNCEWTKLSLSSLNSGLRLRSKPRRDKKVL